MESNFYDFPGLIIRSSLQGEAWKCVKNISRDDLKGSEGIKKIFKKLDEKYRKDKRLEVIKKVMTYYDIEREQNEKIRDFLDRFEKAKEDCKKVAEEEDEEVVDGWVALYRAKLTETERKIVLGACGEGNQGYQNVKNEMLRIVEKEEVNETKEKRKTGWFLQEANCEATKTNLNPLNKFGKRMRCHKCGSTTHLAYKCKEIVEICWICKSNQHLAAECPNNWINKRKIQEEEKPKVEKEKQKIYNLTGRGNGCPAYINDSKDMDENKWGCVEAIVDTGCPRTIIGEK